MKFFVITSLMLLATTSFADFNSSFDSGLKNAKPALEACKKGKEAYLEISPFLNSQEDNCSYSKESSMQYKTCLAKAELSIDHFENVSSSCRDYNGAQNNIRILNTLVDDANYNIPPIQKLINVYCQ